MVTHAVRVTDRYTDKTRTTAIPDHFNVHVNNRYIGYIYKVGDFWQYGGLRLDRTNSIPSAVDALIVNEAIIRNQIAELERQS